MCLYSYTTTTEEQLHLLAVMVNSLASSNLTSIYASIYRTHAGVHITFIVIIYNIIIHIQDSESKLLLHPVVKSLLSWKWSRYIALFFFINLVLYLIFLSFLTAFALIVPNPQLSICE